jgi:hypothetical protein
LLLACPIARAQEAFNEPATNAAVQRTSIDGVELVATLDRDRIALWEFATLRLELRAPEGTRIDWPELPEQAGELTITPAGVSAPIFREGFIEATRAWRIEAFLPGQYEAPAVDVGITTASGSTRTLHVNPFTLTAESAISEGDPALAAQADGTPSFEPAPLREAPPLKEPSDSPIAWIVGAGVGVLALGAGAWAMIAIASRRRPRAIAHEDVIDLLARAITAGDAPLALAYADGTLREAMSPVSGLAANEPLSSHADAMGSLLTQDAILTPPNTAGLASIRRDLVACARDVVRARYAPNDAPDALALTQRVLNVVQSARMASALRIGAATPSVEGAA